MWEILRKACLLFAAGWAPIALLNIFAHLCKITATFWMKFMCSCCGNHQTNPAVCARVHLLISRDSVSHRPRAWHLHKHTHFWGLHHTFFLGYKKRLRNVKKKKNKNEKNLHMQNVSNYNWIKHIGKSCAFYFSISQSISAELIHANGNCTV